MERLEVSGAVRPLKRSLGVKGLIYRRFRNKTQFLFYDHRFNTITISCFQLHSESRTCGKSKREGQEISQLSYGTSKFRHMSYVRINTFLCINKGCS